MTGGQGEPSGVDHTAPVWFGGDTPRQSAPPGLGAAGGSTVSGGAPGGAPSHGRGRGGLVLLVVAVLVLALTGLGTYAVTQATGDDTSPPTAATSEGEPSATSEADPAPVQQGDAEDPDWTATAEAVSPSVVAITVRGQGGAAQGSGVIYDDEGLILTNNHVVESGENGRITVTLADGRTYDATIVGRDPATDLAVVGIDNPPEDLNPIEFGDSEALEVGQPVMAIGNPLGLAGTVTTGIVSAVDRPVSTGARQSGPGDSQLVVTNAIQTSAAINPGNSGGALVTGGGLLVGINSSIATLGATQGSPEGNIGIGFAIPVNMARMIADQLIATGKADHSFLGIVPEPGTAQVGEAVRAGAQVGSVVEGSPAATAGLRTGDLIIAIDGEPVRSAISLVAHIRERPIDNEVALTVIRDGQRQELSATLAARPSD